MIAELKKKYTHLKEEISSYTKQEKIFIFFAMLCIFFICCEYSFIRPISNSLFITNFSTTSLPYVWLIVVPFNFFIVSLYNRCIPKWGSKRFFNVFVSCIIVMHTFIGLFSKKMFFLPFIFYAWKEIYVLLMFQLIWSVIHANIQFKKATYLYGIFFGIGGLGSTLGSSIPGFFALSCGSENLILFSLPLYVILLFTYRKMTLYCKGDVPKVTEDKKGGFLHGIQLISNSRFLIFILLIVICMQMMSAIIDFQFNYFLEKIFQEKDMRTQYCARILGIVHTITVVFQFIGTYALIKWIGFRGSHYFVPSCLFLFVILFLFFPVFPLACLLFISCKSLDFSFFGVIKEMLYIPLKPDEKFRAKSVIDVFAYRGSKALASILMIATSSLVSLRFLSWLNIFIIIGWIFSVAYGLKEYNILRSAEEGSV